MAKLFDRVMPGDLITSNFMNSILDTIESLDSRITKLETVTPDNRVSITGLDPPTGPYRIGQRLTINGKNFEYMLGGLRVHIDGNLAIKYIEASDTKVVFNIPELPITIPESGKDVLLTVSNRTSTDSRMITLKPLQEPLIGSVYISLGDTVEEGNILPDQPATFKFNLQSNVQRTAMFVISPTISVDTNQQVWQSRLQVLNKNKEVRSARDITLTKGENQDFYIRITTIPSGTEGKEFGLTVEAGADGVKNSLIKKYTVGSPPPQEDTNIHLNVAAVTDPVNNDAPLPTEDYSSGIIRRAVNEVARVVIDAVFDAAGKYTVSVKVTGTKWIVHLNEPTPTSTTTTTESGEYDVLAGATKLPRFSLRPEPGASATGEVEFSVKRNDLTYGRTLRFGLALK